MTRALPPKDAELLLQYPKYAPVLRVYVDRPRRVSTCQECKQPIIKKEKRLTFYLTSYRRQYRNGGNSSHQKFFMHPECGRRLLTECAPSQPKAMACWGCREELTVDGGANPVCVSSRSNWASICNACADLPRFRKCDVCGVYFTKYMTSMLAENPWVGHEMDGPRYACDFCVECDGLVTVKVLKRIEKKERRFQDQYERIVNSYQRGELFDG